MMTGKQERNQVPGPSVTHNPAMPGPDETAAIASAQSSSTAAGATGPAITGATSFGSNPVGGA